MLATSRRRVHPVWTMTELPRPDTVVRRFNSHGKGDPKMRRLRDRGGAEGTRYTLREKMFSVGDDF